MAGKQSHLRPYAMLILFLVSVTVVSWVWIRGDINMQISSPSFILAVLIILTPIVGEIVMRYMRVPYDYNRPLVQTNFEQTEDGKMSISVKNAVQEHISIRTADMNPDVDFNVLQPQDEAVEDDLYKHSSKIRNDTNGVVINSKNCEVEACNLEKGARIQVFAKDDHQNEILVSSRVFR